MKKIILLLFIILVTQNTSAQWQQCSFPSKTEVNFIKIKKNNIFAATRKDGIYLSTNNGLSWETKNKGLEDVGFREIFEFGDYLFALPEPNVDRYYYSTNNGENWILRDEHFRVEKFGFIGNKLLAGTNSFLMISADTGKSWMTTSPLLNVVVNSFAVKDSIIYAFANGQGLYFSTDNGENWIAKKSSIDKEPVSEIIAAGDKLFAAVYQKNVLVSTDEGSTWETTKSGIGFWTSMVFSSNYIFASSYRGGVVASTNHGADWELKSLGLTNLGVRTIAADGDNVFVGTDSGGVFRAKLIDFVTGVKEAISSDFSLQISPQPCDDFLQISGWNLSTISSAENITIFNLLGETVKQEPINGKAQFQMNITDLNAGIYYLKIGNETKMFVKK